MVQRGLILAGVAWTVLLLSGLVYAQSAPDRVVEQYVTLLSQGRFAEARTLTLESANVGAFQRQGARLGKPALRQQGDVLFHHTVRRALGVHQAAQQQHGPRYARKYQAPLHHPPPPPEIVFMSTTWNSESLP